MNHEGVLSGSAALDAIKDSQADRWFVSSLAHEEEGHLNHATYLYDPRISLRWGRTVNDPFVTEWTRKAFGDSPCSSFTCEALAFGNPIYSQVLVSVDGGRGALPLPRPGSLVVDSERLTIAMLIHDLEDPNGSYPFRSTILATGLELPDWFTGDRP